MFVGAQENNYLSLQNIRYLNNTNKDKHLLMHQTFN